MGLQDRENVLYSRRSFECELQCLVINVNVSEMTLGFTDIFFEFMSKHITHKIITCSDKDAPCATTKTRHGSLLR